MVATNPCATTFGKIQIPIRSVVLIESVLNESEDLNGGQWYSVANGKAQYRRDRGILRCASALPNTDYARSFQNDPRTVARRCGSTPGLLRGIIDHRPDVFECSRHLKG